MILIPGGIAGFILWLVSPRYYDRLLSWVGKLVKKIKNTTDPGSP